MGKSIGILNNIRMNKGPEYQERVPVASQENLLSVGIALEKYDLLYTEFFPALFGKIGKTIIEKKLFNNPLARFKTGTVQRKQDVEEIFIEMAKAEGVYDPQGTNPLGRREGPDVDAIFHRENRKEYYALTVGDLDVMRVFRSEAALDSFIAGLIDSVYSGANYDEYLHMKNLLGSYDGYATVDVPGLMCESHSTGDWGDTDIATVAKNFIKTIRKLVMDLSFPSTNYNKAGVRTWTAAQDLVLFINKDLLAEIDVEILSKAFNMGKTDIQVEIVPMEDFGELTGDTLGLLVDKDFFRIYDTLSKMEPQRNAQGLFTNYFYHVHQILSLSSFKNAVRIVGECPQCLAEA